MNKKKSSFIGIRDIAKMANVSTATVSRVINHPERCSQETIDKVQKIISEHNYIPNETIKNIFSGSSNTIAIFIHDINNFFYTQLIVELNTICFEHHYSLLICDTENNKEREEAYLKFCIAKRCEGIIITEGIFNELFNDISIPIVTLDRSITANVSSVTSEGYHSIRHMINYLSNLGHEKIGFVIPETNLSSVENRYQGYLDELESQKIPFKDHYVYRSHNKLDTYLGKKALNYYLSLSDMPTAILCANDMIALGIINEAMNLNLKIPQDLSVCGFDNSIRDISYIPLTTIEQNITKLAEKLFEAITNEGDEITHEIIPSKFIPGCTCCRAKQ